MSGRAFLRTALALVALVAVGLPSLSYAAVGLPLDLEIVGSRYTNDTTPTFTWSAGTGATWYEYKVDGGSYTGIGNVFTQTLSTQANGWHTFTLRSHNNAGEVSSEMPITFEIDTVGPTVPTVSPSTATEDEAVSFTVAPSGEAWTSSCTLYVAGSSVGTMTRGTSTFSKTYTFTNDGSYTVYATCTDGDNNTTTGASRTVIVSDEDNDDNDTFVVPSVSQSSATEDEELTFSVYPYGDNDIIDCDLYVSGSYAADMWESGSAFETDYTFTNDGSYTVYARCYDDEDQDETGSSRTVTVTEEDVDNNDAEEGDLIKLVCSSYAGVNDPCRAVYYWGEDDKRHAFPNEDVYFSWYNDFDDVIEVGASFMDDLLIGHNVTIKPGTSVVKFATSDAVYAVAEGGILRHYLTPSLIVSDYGSDWATEDQVIISDVFFSNYEIGSDIDSSSDYDPDDAEDGVTSIDDNF